MILFHLFRIYSDYRSLSVIKLSVMLIHFLIRVSPSILYKSDNVWMDLSEQLQKPLITLLNMIDVYIEALCYTMLKNQATPVVLTICLTSRNTVTVYYLSWLVMYITGTFIKLFK